MKHVLAGIVVGAVLIGWALIVTWALGSHPLDDKCLQQQAGYQVALTSQTKMLTTQIDLLAKEKVRAGLLQAAHTALQQELASTLAAKVGKIDDVWALKMPKSWDGGSIKAKIVYKTSTECKDSPCATVEFEQEPIEQLAARMAPVEAAVKEVAKQEGGFIPGAVRGQWAEAFLRVFGRGK